VNIAIDDFGQVTRRLGILPSFRSTRLKIDRSFIITMAKDRDSMNIVSTIFHSPIRSTWKVVAEGVDSRNSRDS